MFVTNDIAQWAGNFEKESTFAGYRKEYAVKTGSCMMEKQEESNAYNAEQYQRTQMQKELIIQKLKDKGARLTKQRLMLLDIILEDACSCCKEIYYKAAGKDEKIGLATVYRMVNTLEEIGAISRKNMYKIVCGEDCEMADFFTVVFDDGTVTRLSPKEWYQIVYTGLKACGYMQGRELRSVSAKTCDCSKSVNDKISQQGKKK